MIKPEQIPNEVVEAAAYKYLFYCPRLKTHDEAIRAAIAAALNAWPEACKSESGVRWRWWIELPIEEEQ
jgi:hypothetical protein